MKLDGVFARVAAGMGYGALNLTEWDGVAGQRFDGELDGNGFTFNASIGGLAFDRVTAYGDIYTMYIKTPEVDMYKESPQHVNNNMLVLGIGPGMGYHWIQNYHVGIAPGLHVLIIDDKENNSYSQWGFGMHIIGGKEWSITEGLAMGAAISLYVGTANDEYEHGCTQSSGGFFVHDGYHCKQWHLRTNYASASLMLTTLFD